MRMKLRPAVLALALVVGLPSIARAAEVFADPVTNGQIDAAGMPDLRSSVSVVATSTSNAAIVLLNGGKGVVGFYVSGLAAAGAVMTPEFTNDGGAHWSAGTLISNGASVSTIAADGPALMDAAGHTAVRLRVSTAGTGTISVSANATSVSTDPALRTTLNTIATNTTGAATAANQATANGSLATIASNTGGLSAAPTASGVTSLSSTSASTVIAAATRNFWRVANNNGAGGSDAGCTDDGSTPTATHWTIRIYASGFYEAMRPGFVSNQAIQCIGITGAVVISGESF